MKTEAHQILGKPNSGTYLKYAVRNTKPPRSQLMRQFSDNICYEFYCDSELKR
jgi:hypothetical protein